MSAARSSRPPQVIHDVDANVLDNGRDSWTGRVTFEARVGKHTVRLDLEQCASPSGDGTEAPVVAFLSFHPHRTHGSAACFELDGYGADVWPILGAVEAVIATAGEKYRTLGLRALALAKAKREKALSRPRRPRRALAATRRGA